MGLVAEAADHDATVSFRDVLGATDELLVDSGNGARVTILDVGRATRELSTPEQVDLIDRVEVGCRASPKIRMAFEVSDAKAAPRLAMVLHKQRFAATPASSSRRIGTRSPTRPRDRRVAHLRAVPLAAMIAAASDCGSWTSRRSRVASRTVTCRRTTRPPRPATSPHAGSTPRSASPAHFSVSVTAASRSADPTMTRSAKMITRRSRSSRALCHLEAISRAVRRACCLIVC